MALKRGLEVDCSARNAATAVRTAIVSHLLIPITILLISSSAGATTKGLNQIVTPDIQPDGVLSLSLQQTDPNITNRYQAQFEYGFTKRFEAALFQGFSPDEQVLNVEYGIIQQKHFLLSTGFANWSTKGVAAQPYIEAGYLKGNSYVMVGVTEQVVQDSSLTKVTNMHQLQSILGCAYRVTPSLLLQTDYQAGQSNFSTAGFTYTITPNVQINPSLYLSNASPVKGYGYVVVTYSVTVHG